MGFLRTLALVLMFACAIGLYYVSRWEGLDVRAVHIQGTEDLALDLESRTEDYLDSRVTPIWNTRNVFLVPIGGLQGYLMDEFPGIKSLDITRSLNGSITLAVQERAPALALCNPKGLCGKVGKDGVIIDMIKPDERGELLWVERAFETRPGGQVFSEREVEWFLTIQRMYQTELGLPLQLIRVAKEKNETIIEVHIVMQTGYYLRVDFETDVVYQGEVLRQVLATKLPPEQRSNLDYIDLRVQNRAYYKMKK